MKINSNFNNLVKNYLFSDIAKKTTQFVQNNPDIELYRLGIGDVTRPLVPAVIEAMQRAVNEMGTEKGFRGYGEYRGYAFLQEAISGYYAQKGIDLVNDEIFINDGAKSDLGNIVDIFSNDNIVLVPDPVYPVYVDTNIMSGRKIKLIEGNKQNGFLPIPDKNTKADIIYLCSPNNPTGAVYGYAELKKWVYFALENKAVILFDAAYEKFISDPSLPSSIYCIEGAKKCAIEFCSLSKTAGFTGTRCGYTIVPNELRFEDVSLNDLWFRRQSTKFNGVPYIIQRGAEAVFSPQGQKQISADVEYYKQNAKVIADTLKRLNIWFCGGVNSPYVWLECPNKMPSWEFFDLILSKAHIVGTPGAGFGKAGEEYFRFTAFGNYQKISAAMKNLENALK